MFAQKLFSCRVWLSRWWLFIQKSIPLYCSGVLLLQALMCWNSTQLLHTPNALDTTNKELLGHFHWWFWPCSVKPSRADLHFHHQFTMLSWAKPGIGLVQSRSKLDTLWLQRTHDDPPFSLKWSWQKHLRQTCFVFSLSTVFLFIPSDVHPSHRPRDSVHENCKLSHWQGMILEDQYPFGIWTQVSFLSCKNQMTCRSSPIIPYNHSATQKPTQGTRSSPVSQSGWTGKLMKIPLLVQNSYRSSSVLLHESNIRWRNCLSR